MQETSPPPGESHKAGSGETVENLIMNMADRGNSA